MTTSSERAPAGVRRAAWTMLVPALALAAMLWSVRGAPLGVPVADDYCFLDRLAFQHPLDWFDSMGASYYWRPLSRQLYFASVGPWLPRFPALVPVLHLLLLLGTSLLVFRAASRRVPAPVAAALAAVPLTAEPARVLLGWASGAQHLLAMLLSTLAIERALAGRRLEAALAAAAGLLCHETAVLALFALPMIGAWRRRGWRGAAGWSAIAFGIALAWGIGYRISVAHGVLLPRGAGGFDPAALPGLYRRAVAAAFDLEDRGGAGTLFAVADLLLLVAAAVLAARAGPRRRLAQALPAIVCALLWFALGTLPLVALMPDWNAWRDSVPALGLGVAAILLLGAASPPLATAFAVLRIAALSLAPVAPAEVTRLAPEAASDVSFVRLSRLQRTVNSARVALTGRFAALPPRADVRYWLLPQRTEFGFEGPRAVRCWYRDASIGWDAFGGLAGLLRAPDALIEFDVPRASPAAVIETPAVMGFRDGLLALEQGRLERADSLLDAALRAQPRFSGPFFASVCRSRARIACRLGALARADSLNRLDLRWAGESASTFVMAARLAWAQGNAFAANAALHRAVELEPDNPEARELAATIGLLRRTPP